MADYPVSKPAAVYNPNWGNPVILYLDPEEVGKPGYQMFGPATRIAGSTGLVTDHRYHLATVVTKMRHLTLQESVSLNNITEEQLGARRLRVSIPWYDVTNPGVYDHLVEAAGDYPLENDGYGGDY